MCCHLLLAIFSCNPRFCLPAGLGSTLLQTKAIMRYLLLLLALSWFSLARADALIGDELDVDYLPSEDVASKSYEYFLLGDSSLPVDIPSPAEPSLVAMGGGPDVDSAYRWMIKRSGVRPWTGGRFVIIRASGTDAYNPYIYYSGEDSSLSQIVDPEWVGGAAMGLSSVETLVIPDRESANDKFVNYVLSRAHAVFIAGGDQSDYIKYWKRTALHSTLIKLMRRNVPVGGTSAGLAILGQFDFSAMVDTVYSEEALMNPYNEFMTLDPDPLSLTGGFLSPPAFRNTILDSHLDTRDRMGRLLTFVSRLVASHHGGPGCPGGSLGAGTPYFEGARGIGTAVDTGNSYFRGARGIGVGVETALLVEGDGLNTPFTGRRVTNPSTTTDSAVYFVRPSRPARVCAANMPLTVEGMEIRKLNDDSVFNITEWSGKPPYTIDVTAGVLSDNPY